jgi:HlyD family secretion protein
MSNMTSLDSQKRSPQSLEGENGLKRPAQSPEGDAAFQRAAPPKGKPVKTIRRLIPLAIVACALAVGGAGAWYWWQQQLSALPPGIAKANGRLESEQAEIATKYPGRIAAVLAREGQMVDAGEVVARMDTAELEAQLLAAEAKVRKAEHEKTQAEAVIVQRDSERTFASQELQRTSTLYQ